MDFASLPKIELHLHLDCSLSYKVVSQLRPETSYEEFQQSYVCPAKCLDLAEYIERAIRGVELMQTKEQLRLVTIDLLEQLKADNVIYAEIRFAPLLHTQKGLSPAEVVSAVNEALTEGMQQTGVIARLILCTLRHYSEAQSMETVKLVEQFAGTNVAGFDIAADEAGFPIDNHIAAFQYAKSKNIFCTAHAGEARGADSVWETLRHFHPSRIGHGVRSIEDPELIRFLKQEDIHLEVCPTSNIQTNVYDKFTDHTADQLYKTGVSMSINTDGRMLTPVTLTSEYQLLHETFNWEKEHFLRCNLEAISHAFIPDTLKAELAEKIRNAFA